MFRKNKLVVCQVLAAIALSFTIAKTAECKDYQVSIETTDRGGAGTDSNIDIRIYGSKGETTWVRLNPLIKGDAFESGDTDTATLKDLKDVGVITSVEVKSDCKYAGSGWHLPKIIVNGKSGTFDCWIEDKECYSKAVR